jgi:hypothetical protein
MQNKIQDCEPDRPAEPAVGVANASRRKFAKSALTAAPVILTLASKPVLGNTVYHHCTVSGNASGNVSTHAGKDATCYTCTDAKNDWHTQATWPGCDRTKVTFKEICGEDYDDGAGDKTDGQKCLWVLTPDYENYKGQGQKLTGQGTYYDAGHDKGKSDAVNYDQPWKQDSYPKYAGTTAQYDYPGGCSDSGDREKYRNGHDDGYQQQCEKNSYAKKTHCSDSYGKWALAKVCVHSILNARLCGDKYGVKEQEIKDIWKACKGEGSYLLPGTKNVYWNASQCKTFLENQYSVAQH